MFAFCCLPSKRTDGKIETSLETVKLEINNLWLSLTSETCFSILLARVEGSSAGRTAGATTDSAPLAGKQPSEWPT